MIPFKLFKYIFFRNIVYNALYSIVFCLGAVVFFVILGNISPDEFTFLAATVSFVILSIFYSNKLTLKKLFFKEYNKIMLESNYKKAISNKFTILFVLFTILIPMVFYILLEIFIITPKHHDITLSSIILSYAEYENNIVLSSVMCIIETFVYYLATNLFLEKYITVNWKQDNNANGMI
ncbi:MAG: hypothetical protein IJ848_02725 [Alphaproteobacteria bacterium]|nr:hypothetical protein [Alphaproteobacteria bacterium]